jgi:hypothetical protein
MTEPTAPPDAAPAKPGKDKPPKKSGSFLGWLMLSLPIMLGLGIFYPPLLMILALMAPGWFALLSDTSQERALAVCVSSGALAGAMFTAAPYFLHVPALETTAILLQNPEAWLYPLGGSAAGAVLFYVMPLVMAESVYLRNQVHRKALEAAQKKLTEEWGEEVKG